MAQPLTLFYNNGKIFIGGLVDSVPASSINSSITTPSDYYVISSPCEIDFTLEENDNDPAHIKFKRFMPLCPIKISSKDGENNKVLFAFEKSSTYLSNVTGASLNSDVLNAYRIMTGVTTLT